MKRPSFQFYPGDWQANSNLRRCSHAEKGVWIDVMCLLHDQEEYGVLRWTLKEISRAVGCPMGLLKSLIDKGVLKGDDKRLEEAFIYVPKSGRRYGDPVTLVPTQDGPIWYSSRMVKDEYVRTIRGEATRFGGGDGDAPIHPPEPTPNPTPTDSPKPPFGDGSSSSSPSSSSIKGNKELLVGVPPDPPDAAGAATPPDRGKRLPKDWALPKAWGEWALAEFSAWTPEFVRLEADKFRDHWTAKSGADARKVDWFATWRNWCRNARPPAAQGAAAAGAPSVDPESRSAIEAVGIAKGIGPWNETEQWALYKARVRGPSKVGFAPNIVGMVTNGLSREAA